MAIAVFHGDKGGCGKSTAAMCYAEFLASQGKEFLVIDCDPRNADVSRYVASFAAQSARIDLRGTESDRDEGWYEVLALLGESPFAEVLISLPASIGSVVVDHVADLHGVAAESALNVRYFWVLDSSVDSIVLLGIFAAAVGWARIVVLQNRFFGGDLDFGIWLDSATRKELLAGGGREFDFPKLGNALTRLTLRAMPPVRLVDRETLHYGKRWVIKTWLESTFAGFAV